MIRRSRKPVFPFERDKSHEYEQGEELCVGDLIISKVNPTSCHLAVYRMDPWKRERKHWRRDVVVRCRISRNLHQWKQIRKRKPEQIIEAKDHFLGWLVWPKELQ